MAEGRPRIEWMDLVKGTTVIVIVLSHAIDLMEPIAGGHPIQHAWSLLETILEPMRMCLFFMVSGMLATAAVTKPWNKVRRRTWGMAYLYVLWSAIFFAVVYIYAPLPIIDELGMFARNLAVAGNGYWYLYALIVYFVLARLTRRWPIWILLGVAVVLNLMKYPLISFYREHLAFDTGSMIVKVLINLVFFLIGLHFKEILARITQYATWPRIAALIATVIVIGVWRFNTPWSWEESFLPASLLYMVLAIMLASKLIAYQGPRRFGTVIGTQTLPIFVVQFPFLLALSQVFKNDDLGFYQNPIFLLLFPIAFTAFNAVFALWLHRITLNGVGKYLFEVPEWIAHEGKKDEARANPQAA
ncbi:MAG: acyltransferase family protein [Candidatus Nanopelagicales bacterium]